MHDYSKLADNLEEIIESPSKQDHETQPKLCEEAKFNAYLIIGTEYLPKNKRDPALVKASNFEGWLIPKERTEILKKYEDEYIIRRVYDPIMEESKEVQKLIGIKFIKLEERRKKLLAINNYSKSKNCSFKELENQNDYVYTSLKKEYEEIEDQIKQHDKRIEFHRVSGKNTEETKKEESSSWKDPIPLKEILPPVLPMLENMIPEPFRAWIMDIAERMQIPPDFSAAAAIVICSSLVGRSIGVFPKEKDNWLAIPNLWGAVVGRPSLMKSPAINEILKPLDKLIAQAINNHEKEIVDYKFTELTNKTSKKQLEDELKKECRNKNPNQEKFRQRFSELEQCAQPTEKRYRTEDGTIEKIGELLRENPRGLLIHRDELMGFFRNLEREGRNSDRAFFLESWNGSGSFTYDRIGRGTIHIPALCLSILGGIQPGPLSSYIHQTLKGGIGDDGLLQRFQILVWPDMPGEWINIDRWPDNEAKKRAYIIFEALDKLVPAIDSASTDSEIPGIRFSKEGQNIFNNWRCKLERKIRSGELLPAMESHLAKYRSLMPSLSLLFQLIENADFGKDTYEIDESNAKLAIQWCDYLESHANRLYSSVENHAVESAQALLSRIRKGEIQDGFTSRDIYSNHWSKLATPEETSQAIAVLRKNHWLVEKELKTGGRDKILYWIHPKIAAEKIKDA